MAKSNLDVPNLDQFVRANRQIQSNLPTNTTEASQQIARDWVSAASNAANTGQAQLAAQALRMEMDSDGATIRNNSPLFFGSEFGGQARPETMHFPPHNGRRGYWFYPARRTLDDTFMGIWDKSIEVAMRPWGTGG